MLKRYIVSIKLILGVLCIVITFPAFACWQTGHGYDPVLTDHLVFGYLNHKKPALGVHLEIHKANWADGATDDQSRVPQGPLRLARWQAGFLKKAITDSNGKVEFGDVAPGKYYVVQVSYSSGKPEEAQGFPIEVRARRCGRQSQTMWLNWYADGCTQVVATDEGTKPELLR